MKNLKFLLKELLLKKNFTIRRIIILLTQIKFSHFNKVSIENHGIISIKKYIDGKNNKIVVGKKTILNNTKIRIVGNNNRIIFGENVVVGPKCSFWMEGNNITIQIGNGTTFTHTVHFCAQEDNISILVGEDCMFANTIIVRTSDSHPIYDLKTRQRINPAKDVIIGNHVWIAPNTKIMKGANIGNNSIIGSNTMVTKSLPSNCLAVGSPAKIVKTSINWTREKIF